MVMRMGNPQKASRFICCKCKQMNRVGEGIQRKYGREKGHVKDLYCLNCDEVTKNVEVRYCDVIETLQDKVDSVHDEFYLLV